MNIGSYFRIEGMLLASAAGLCLQACDGAFWTLGDMRGVDHLLQNHVIVEGIRTGAQAMAVNWIEAIAPSADLTTQDLAAPANVQPVLPTPTIL